MIQVEIITIGDELLIGQVIDTNSAWMAPELNKRGFDVRYKTTVGDNEADIIEAFEQAKKFSELYCTGCKYCIDCPQKIDLAKIFELYTYYNVYGNVDLTRRWYKEFTEDKNRAQISEQNDCRQ